MPPGRSQPVGGGLEQCLVAGFGDQELHVGVRDVTSQVLVAPRVVQPYQRRSRRAPHRTARTHSPGVLSRSTATWGGRSGSSRAAVQGGKSLGFDEEALRGSTPGHRNEAQGGRQ